MKSTRTEAQSERKARTRFFCGVVLCVRVFFSVINKIPTSKKQRSTHKGGEGTCNLHQVLCWLLILTSVHAHTQQSAARYETQTQHTNATTMHRTTSEFSSLAQQLNTLKRKSVPWLHASLASYRKIYVTLSAKRIAKCILNYWVSANTSHPSQKWHIKTKVKLSK